MLIVVPLLGGVAAWWSERLNPDLPRWVSLATIVIALLCLQGVAGSLPADQFALVPEAARGASWPLYEYTAWIPRFGIAIELGMDGLSLLLVVLTLSLIHI